MNLHSGKAVAQRFNLLDCACYLPLRFRNLRLHVNIEERVIEEHICEREEVAACNLERAGFLDVAHLAREYA